MTNIVETQMEGGRHLMINLSMIDIIKRRDTITFYGDQEQIKLISQTYKDIEFVPIRVQKQPPLWKIPYIILSHLLILTKLLAQRKPLVILSIFPVTHYFFKIITLFFPKTKVKIILHGELKQITNYNTLLQKLLGVFLRRALSIKNRNIKYIVLGNTIGKRILQKKWLNQNEMIIIDHPYDYTLRKNSHKPNSQYIRFGSIGATSIQKGTHYFCELANEMRNKQLKFSVVGGINPEIKPYLTNKIEYSNTPFLSREEFEDRVSQLDAAVFFYNAEEYAYTSSGAFFDAIKFELPIFAIRNEFYDDYFTRFGEIGILFDDKKELFHYFNDPNLFQHFSLQKVIWKQNLEKIKKQLSEQDYFF